MQEHTPQETPEAVQTRKILQDIVALVERFEPDYDGIDEVREFYFPLRRKWIRFKAQKVYGNTWFHSDLFDSFCVAGASEDPRENQIPELHWDELLCALQQVESEVRQDALGYHRELMNRLPVSLRKGVVHARVVRELVPDFRRFDLELGEQAYQEAIRVIDEQREEALPVMTAGTFFEYCKVAYWANPDTFKRWRGEGLDPKASGRDLYTRWADGRDEGLRNVPLDSPEEFSKWYDGPRFGGHPWEIYRGGNSTHIDLYPHRLDRERGWEVVIRAFSSSRMAEACRIAVALDRAGMPFRLEDSASYLLRLRNLDWIGIVPERWSIKYAWHYFPKEFDVADCIHFSWFRDERTGKFPRPPSQIQGLVHGLPMVPLRLKS